MSDDMLHRLPRGLPSPARDLATRAILLLVLLLLLLLPALGAPPLAAAGDEAGLARRIVSGLSLEEKAGQLLLIGIEGKGAISQASLELVRKLGPGGILLFGFNIPERALDLGPLLGALQDSASLSRAALPLLVALDHEGGTVFRFHGGITRPPSAQETATRGPTFARLLGERAGKELRALGVNLVLGPVVEALTEGNRAFLGSRSFGRDASTVDAVAGSYIEGLSAAGVAATAKHFPGNSLADPHEALPRLPQSRAEIRGTYLPRFAAAIAHGVPAVMLSHVLVPSLDPRRPATLSPALVSGLLRGELGFDGLVLTDDLLMKALDRTPQRSAVEALAAGADLLMLSSGRAALPVRDAIVAAVAAGSLDGSRVDEAAIRVVALKLRLGLASSLDPAARSSALAGFADTVAESARLLALSGRRPP